MNTSSKLFQGKMEKKNKNSYRPTSQKLICLIEMAEKAIKDKVFKISL